MRLIYKLFLPVGLLGCNALLIIALSLWWAGDADRSANAAMQELTLIHDVAEVRSTSRALQRDALNLIFEPEAGSRTGLGRRAV